MHTVKALRFACFVLLYLFLAGCGGGGSSPEPTSTVAPPRAPTSPPPQPAVPSNAELRAASQLASKSTFGMPYESIVNIARLGPEVWLDRQLSMRPTSHLTFVEELVRRRDAGDFSSGDDGILLTITFWRGAWWNRTMTAPDQVQQRVAYALSQIFVISDIDILRDYPPAIPSFNDVLLKGSTGNFRELLLDVALHPAMGIYLSHINNRKANPEENIFPDENFAREVMQLFSIGLFELNEDGSYQLDSEGNPVPTYDNDDIREYAKIFTGLSWNTNHYSFGRLRNAPPNYRDPMKMYEEHHSPGEKHLLGGMVVPEGQTGLEDINSAIDSLFNHPNVGPFIGRLLIQRLTTSNPSPEYISRVTAAFNGDQTGVRGDMRAVVKAILLDPEVTRPAKREHFGKLREPVLRLAALARQFNAECEDGLFYNVGYRLNYFANQYPYGSPSVFNFYSPNHSPAGPLANSGLVAPEFQIATATNAIGIVNQLDLGLFSNGDQLFDPPEQFTPTLINIDDYVELAADISALLQRLDIVMTYGQLDSISRSRITSVLEEISDLRDRTRHAIYLMALSPAYAVEA